MLVKFKEDREKRKMAPPSIAATNGSSSASGATPSRDPRGGRDDYRDRDRGYERHSSSRHEYVHLSQL